MEKVLSNFDAFLVDHASCERKASAQALALVARYPEKTRLVEALIALAREELEHFHDCAKLCHRRGLILGQEDKDPYVRRILTIVRHGRDEWLLDRLLVAAVIEARSFEKIALVAEALPRGDLQDFYVHLRNAESGHSRVFVRLARFYFSDPVVAARLEDFLAVEALAHAEAPIRGTFH